MERNKASCRKLAVTVWNNRIAPVFDVAGRVLVTDVEDGGLANERLMDLQGQSASEKLGFLSALGVGHIICGAISREAFFLARMLGMDVMPFVAGEVETVLSGWLSGTL
ncbi:MAG TPA: NifB/NifX family molybdenum-iron cluster-binding protein, partial [Spirochaetia bacterium]|nr:NifB/NifX family molybdenum-iron cluster-binding protein [Spirochaetia bacterium]